MLMVLTTSMMYAKLC